MIDFDGIQGKVRIDAFGDAERRTYLSVVRGGRFEVVR